MPQLPPLPRSIVLVLLATLPFLLLRWVMPSVPAPMAVDQAQFASFDGGRIRFEQAGAGAGATVFIHGFNGQLGGWDGVWSHMDACGQRLRLDVPGFGGSRLEYRRLWIAGAGAARRRAAGPARPRARDARGCVDGRLARGLRSPRSTRSASSVSRCSRRPATPARCATRACTA